MSVLGPYILDTELNARNAGYCMWGFGRDEGRNIFIKQFLSPKYPSENSGFSPRRLEQKLAECTAFEKLKREVYSVVNECSDGNDVRILDFFRIGSRYYMCMEKVEALEMTPGDIFHLSWAERLRLCTVIAHAVAGLHSGGLIHADLKHDNVLFTYTHGGCLTAKVIDFDSSFLEESPPAPGEDIVGDLVYFSPEALLRMEGDDVPLTTRMDIFSLGILFHQYLAGSMPEFDSSRHDYLHTAVLNGEVPGISDSLPPMLAELLGRMLDAEPQQRPTAAEVCTVLRQLAGAPEVPPGLYPRPLWAGQYPPCAG